MWVFSYIVVALALFSTAAAGYIVTVGYPSSPNDWVKLWAGVGGISAPLISFAALAAVAHGLGLQAKAYATDIEQRSQERQLRAVDQWLHQIEEHLDRRDLAVADAEVSLRTILRTGKGEKPSNEQALKASLKVLVRLMCEYCDAVAIYQANADPFFDVKMYRNRADMLFDLLSPFTGYLDDWSMISASMAKERLDNDEETPD